MFSAVPWTRTTGRGCAALGVQATLAPGGGGVAAAAGPAARAQARTVKAGGVRRRMRGRCHAAGRVAPVALRGRGLDERLGEADARAVLAALRVPLHAE